MRGPWQVLLLILIRILIIFLILILLLILLLFLMLPNRARLFGEASPRKPRQRSGSDNPLTYHLIRLDRRTPIC